MNSARPGLSKPRPSRRKFDHEAAERYWRNDAGQRRTFAEVAEEFGVSVPSVLAAAEREDWMGTAWRIEEEARRAAARVAVKTVEERIRQSLALIDASKAVYARGLQSGQTAISASELAALLRVEQLLVGGPTERVGGESEAHRRSLDEIEAELAALPGEVVDAQLAADAVVERRVRVLPAASQPDSLDASPDLHPAVSETAVSAPVAPVEDESEAMPVAEEPPAQKGVGRVPYSQTEAYRRYERRVLGGGL